MNMKANTSTSLDVWKPMMDSLTTREKKLMRLSLILNYQVAFDPSGEVVQYFATNGV